MSYLPDHSEHSAGNVISFENEPNPLRNVPNGI